MGSLRLFVAPRNLGHCAKEAASALGQHIFGKLFRVFAIEGRLLELGKAKVVEAVVSLHALGLFFGSGKLGVLSLLKWR